MPQSFPLARYGSLLLGIAVVGGPDGRRDVALLVDTGSNHTVLAAEILEAIGCSAASSRDNIRITTANGIVIAPRVRVQELIVFGQRIDGATVVAHTLPFAGPIDGLLGMDVLIALRARIDVAGAEIVLEGT